MAGAGPGRSVDYALTLLRRLPRITLGNLKGNKEQKKKHNYSRGQDGGSDRGYPEQAKKGSQPPLGFAGGSNPYYTRHPVEWYYRGHELRRQYPPYSLFSLQRNIDMGIIDPAYPIDLVQLCNTKLYHIDPLQRHFGVNLTEEGMHMFKAKINLEVQWTTESVIAAVERNGGTITLAYFDPACLNAMHDTRSFFARGVPIPRRALPPENCLELYSNPKMRGYLADPAAVSLARVELAQKFGYNLPDVTKDPDYEMLIKRKDPRQCFYDLEPGWVVNLKDRTILKPADEVIRQYYRS
ncbi:39S ribosomal protein L15, mitochondrial [Hypsibius exemplaris]|uniref:Large ribosomal subunit protein uL15m n=1 Tax=Hypsibius exemplaris TaxID=2072580 RepID=A0A1W0WY84_HYPEX|nr:39S ribosomal protein L15, mitochondrial [Hypsibius exemplaris]